MSSPIFLKLVIHMRLSTFLSNKSLYECQKIKQKSFQMNFRLQIRLGHQKLLSNSSIIRYDIQIEMTPKVQMGYCHTSINYGVTDS